jgi:copper(I)-binding protein
VAKAVEIHNMSMEGNVMRMHQVPNIALPPATKITMQPGNGYHLMLFGLRQPLNAGESFPMTLTFEKAGKTDVTVTVGNMGMAKEGGMPHMR